MTIGLPELVLVTVAIAIVVFVIWLVVTHL